MFFKIDGSNFNETDMQLIMKSLYNLVELEVLRIGF